MSTPDTPTYPPFAHLSPMSLESRSPGVASEARTSFTGYSSESKGKEPLVQWGEREGKDQGLRRQLQPRHIALISMVRPVLSPPSLPERQS